MTYQDHRAKSNREYRDAYRTWVASLSASERRKLRDQDLDHPHIDPDNTHKPEPVLDTVYAASQSIQPPTAETTTSNATDVSFLLRSILGEIQSNPNVRLTMDCLSIVTSFGFVGASLSEIAISHGVTRAAVSKRCVQLCRTFGISPPPAMRRLTPRKCYATKTKPNTRHD